MVKKHCTKYCKISALTTELLQLLSLYFTRFIVIHVSCILLGTEDQCCNSLSNLWHNDPESVYFCHEGCQL